MVEIDDEFMIISGVTNATQFTVAASGRGYSNTTEVAHNTTGVTVYGVYIGIRHQNTQPWVQTSLTSNVSGKQFYQFSVNGTTWSQYPVTGYDVTADRQEFHQAIKGNRYFRIKFRNTDGNGASTSFNVYTFFGVYNNGMLPLNQSINSDQDSMVVRSVGVGQNPTDTFVNTRVDGEAFITTDDLPGTYLTTELNSGDSEVLVNDVSNFTSGTSLLFIGSEFLSYSGISTGSNSFTIDERGLYGTGTSASYSIGTSVGGVYSSGILPTIGYTQVATKLKAGARVQPRFVWYSDTAGTSIVRTLGPQYPSDFQTAGDFSYLSAPIFSASTVYLLGNVESTTTSDIYYAADFTTKAISSQILTVADELLPQMTANVTKSITVGQQPDGDYVSAPADGEAFNTTTPLGYTTISQSLTDSDTGNVTVADTSTLASTGYLNISANNTVDEIISYSVVDATTINIPSGGRAQFGTTAVSHDNGENLMGVYSSEISEGKWHDTDGYNIIELIIDSDVKSAISGIIIRFTDDTGATNPVERYPVQYTLSEQNVDNFGFKIRIQASLDGYSLLYVTGNSGPQSNFFLSSTHRIDGNANLYSGSGALITGDYSTEVSLGNISNRINVSKFGRNSNIDINTVPEDIWSGGDLYKGHPTTIAPKTVEVVSTDASDTAAGVGAQTIRIEGLRDNAASQYDTEDFTLNGTTPVTSTKNWYRINRGYVLTAGSSEYNVGTITCRYTAPDTSVIFFTIVPQFNQSTACVYTVPAGVTGIIKRSYLSITRASGAAGSALILLQVRDTLGGGVFRSLNTYDIQTGGNIDDVRIGGVILEPGSDIRMRCQSVSDNATIANAEIEIELVARLT